MLPSLAPRKKTRKMSTKTETLFISAVLRQDDHKTPILAGVQPKWFASHYEEWDWIYRYIERHRKCPSKPLFKSKFPDFQIIKSDDVEYCLDELREDYLRRSMVIAVDQVADQVRDDVPMATVMEQLQSQLITLQSDSTGTSNESDVVDDWELAYNEVARRHDRAKERGQSGIPTGFATLDLETNGPQEGDYWIVAARLGQGKTGALIRMACTAVVNGFTVQFDALEQSRAQIAMRSHAFLSSDHAKETFTSSDLMRGQNFDLLSYKKFLAGLKDTLSGKLIVNDTSRGRVTPSTVAAQIERNHPDIVFIDYLTLMNQQAGDWQAIAALSAELKGIAMQYKIPIVAAAQINRMAIGEDLPGAEHLAGADAIGQDADAVVTMKQVSRHIVKMKLAKFRHGSDGHVWDNEFRPNSGYFREVSGDEALEIIDEDRAEA